MKGRAMKVVEIVGDRIRLDHLNGTVGKGRDLLAEAYMDWDRLNIRKYIEASEPEPELEPEPEVPSKRPSARRASPSKTHPWRTNPVKRR